MYLIQFTFPFSFFPITDCRGNDAHKFLYSFFLFSLESKNLSSTLGKRDVTYVCQISWCCTSRGWLFWTCRWLRRVEVGRVKTPREVESTWNSENRERESANASELHFDGIVCQEWLDYWVCEWPTSDSRPKRNVLDTWTQRSTISGLAELIEPFTTFCSPFNPHFGPSLCFSAPHSITQRIFLSTYKPKNSDGNVIMYFLRNFSVIIITYCEPFISSIITCNIVPAQNQTMNSCHEPD